MEKLPTDWVVKITDENRDILNHYRMNVVKYSTYGVHPSYNYMKETGLGLGCKPNYPEITTEQFKRLVLKEKTMEDNKEIIGYKLIKPEYKIPALTICNTVANWENVLSAYDIGVIQTNYIKSLKKAGVLDLWFEPVYKQKEVAVNMNGGFNLTVKNNAVFHKTEDITSYVKSMRNWWETNKNQKFNDYDFKIEDVILSKTGCESKTTTMKDWVKIFELID